MNSGLKLIEISNQIKSTFKLILNSQLTFKIKAN